MSRPLRIEFRGALYHITARGDRGDPIYEDEEDRVRFLEILGEVVNRFGWICYAYCLMIDHYHLIVETPRANLAKGMRHLNGVYTQYSNRRHGQGGHLFQGRYKAVLVDKKLYFLDLIRHVELNPVRIGLAQEPGEWPWTSFNTVMGRTKGPAWLNIDRVLEQFAAQRGVARRRYRKFVLEGIGQESIWKNLNCQIFLGDDRFVQRMQRKLKAGLDDVNIPKAQRLPPPKPLEVIAGKYRDRNRAIVAAYETGSYSYQQIAKHFGLHFTTVGRIVRDARRKREATRIS